MKVWSPMNKLSIWGADVHCENVILSTFRMSSTKASQWMLRFEIFLTHSKPNFQNRWNKYFTGSMKYTNNFKVLEWGIIIISVTFVYELIWQIFVDDYIINCNFRLYAADEKPWNKMNPFLSQPCCFCCLNLSGHLVEWNI